MKKHDAAEEEPFPDPQRQACTAKNLLHKGDVGK